MRTTLAYFKYILKHKWFVLLACWRLDVPLWRALWHDRSKLTRAEFSGYRKYFFDRKDEFRRGQLDPAKVDREFDLAWNHHQKSNPHHWEFWLLIEKGGETRPVPMPETYVREMVADWMGASRAKTGSWDIEEWVIKAAPGLVLHRQTAEDLQLILYSLTLFRAADAVFDAHLAPLKHYGGTK
jgi:hypothetical protein